VSSRHPVEAKRESPEGRAAALFAAVRDGGLGGRGMAGRKRA